MSDNEGTEATASDAGDADAGDDTVEVNAADIVDRVEEHDEALATEVRALVNEARELNARVTELEDDDDDLDSTTDDDVVAAQPVPGEDDATADPEAADSETEAATDAEGADPERVAALEARVEELEADLAETEDALAETESDLEAANEEIDDLTSRLKRKQADFQNYKKRAKKRQEQIKDRATEDLVERLIEVRNNLKRGLEADHEDVESLANGIEMTLKEFDRILEDENVSEIDPEPGEAVDPSEHAVMMRVESTQPEGHIHEVFNPGYRMADKVLEEAQVTVSTGEPPEDADEDAADDGEDGEATDETAADGEEEAVALGGDVDESDADESDGEDAAPDEEPTE